MRAAALLALLLLAAACTSEPDRPNLRHVDIPSATAAPSEVPAASPEPEAPEPTTPSEVDGLGGRLAVLDEGGNLVTMDPDGSNEILLADVEPGLSEVRQPSWSRDGSRLAWVHLHVTEASTLAVGVATSTAEGKKPTESRTLVTPFYLSWDPTSSRIAYLAPGDDGVQLGILELGGHSSGTPLETGQPFYLSWGPNGDELLVHIGSERLQRLGLDGKLTTVSDRPGDFSVPVWTSDGRTFVYASGRDDHQQLVAQDADAGRGRPLVPFGTLITFVVSPDGRRVAFEPFEGEDSLPLTVVDVASGRTTEITSEPAVSFYWSPDGKRLLYLDPDPAEDRTWFRWGVWDGRRTFTTPRFIPSQRMIDEYLPFFEQYEQSMSLWSPDGSAFAYPGMNEDGDMGIWIQSARSDRAPVKVTDGDFVAWSPA